MKWADQTRIDKLIGVIAAEGTSDDERWRVAGRLAKEQPFRRPVLDCVLGVYGAELRDAENRSSLSNVELRGAAIFAAVRGLVRIQQATTLGAVQTRARAEYLDSLIPGFSSRDAERKRRERNGVTQTLSLDRAFGSSETDFDTEESDEDKPRNLYDVIADPRRFYYGRHNGHRLPPHFEHDRLTAGLARHMVEADEQEARHVECLGRARDLLREHVRAAFGDDVKPSQPTLEAGLFSKQVAALSADKSWASERADKRRALDSATENLARGKRATKRDGSVHPSRPGEAQGQRSPIVPRPRPGHSPLQDHWRNDESKAVRGPDEGAAPVRRTNRGDRGTSSVRLPDSAGDAPTA